MEMWRTFVWVCDTPGTNEDWMETTMVTRITTIFAVGIFLAFAGPAQAAHHEAGESHSGHAHHEAAAGCTHAADEPCPHHGDGETCPHHEQGKNCEHADGASCGDSKAPSEEDD